MEHLTKLLECNTMFNIPSKYIIKHTRYSMEINESDTLLLVDPMSKTRVYDIVDVSTMRLEIITDQASHVIVGGILHGESVASVLVQKHDSESKISYFGNVKPGLEKALRDTLADDELMREISLKMNVKRKSTPDFRKVAVSMKVLGDPNLDTVRESDAYIVKITPEFLKFVEQTPIKPTSQDEEITIP